MEMEREINFLSDGELDAVVGGMMNTGQINQLVLKNLSTGFRARCRTTAPSTSASEFMKLLRSQHWLAFFLEEARSRLQT
jgi:hypothetical protein